MASQQRNTETSFPHYDATSDRLAILWNRILRFNDKYFPNWRKTNPVFYSNALAGEVGEICSITKRMNKGGTNLKAHEKENPYLELRNEVFDAFVYSVLLLQSQHTDLDEFFVAAFHKLDELEIRMN